MLVEIENRKINPKFVVEITKPKEYVEFQEKRDFLDTITVPVRKGQYFVSIIVLGAEPVHIIRDSLKEAEEAYRDAERRF